MTKISLVSKLVLTALVVAFNAFFATAQTIEYLDANNVKAGFGVGGNLFTKADSPALNTTWDLFEVPKGSGKTEIFTAALWMCGQDSSGNDYTAANRYFDYGVDYFDGPISTIYDSNYDAFYHRVFKVTKAQIGHFQNFSFPVTASQVDSSILYWPGKGNPSILSDYRVNVVSPLAPFVDINHNGIYEPLMGDYPSIVGDQSIFFVFNDFRGLHTETDGNALGVEVRGMASSFADTNTCVAANGRKALDNTIFVQYDIENKAQRNYRDFNLGLFTDPDVGNPVNDFVGCDSGRGLMFAYNGTVNDANWNNILGYDSLPIALGIQWLNQTMDVFGYYGSGGAMPSPADPTTSSQYCNNLHGLWIDGPPFTYGGTGYGDSTSAITKFLYSGDPNDTTEWSEVENHNASGDRRMYGASGPYTFNRGEIKHFDFAFLTSYDIRSNHIAIVDTLKLDADYIRTFYNNCLLPEQALGMLKLSNEQESISIYPNPAKNEVTIEAGDYIRSIELMDIQGRILLSKEANAKKTVLPVSNLARGIYLVHVQSAGGSVIKRLVVE